MVPQYIYVKCNIMLRNVKLYSGGLQLSAEGIKLLSNAGILPRYGEKKVGQVRDPEPCMAIYIKDSNLVRVFNL